MNQLARQSDLFGTPQFYVPKTEGIKYAGSKLKLLPHILALVAKTDSKSVFDGFSGSTRVSQALACNNYNVICNDKSVWSEIFGLCYLKGGRKSKYRDLIKHLNSCSPKDGWFTAQYGGDSHKSDDDVKKPWQRHNTQKLDAIREEIDNLRLAPVEKAVALTSLILALDQVDSTLGHFSSYLREWSPRSFKSMKLDVPNIVESEYNCHEIMSSDIFDACEKVKADIAYYDPPYGSNNEKMPPSRVRYSAYYHVWTTICLNDKPELFGKVNRRVDTRDGFAASVFEEFRRDEKGRFIAVEAIKKLINSTPTKYILLSYSSGGRATSQELQQVLTDAGRVLDIIEIDYRKNVMAGMKWTNEWLRDADEPNREFLFLIERR